MLKSLSRLRKNRRKILGLNERYLEYIRPNNSKSAFKIADDKILTKEILSKHDIPVPEMIAVIRNHDDLEDLDFDSLPNSFVLKPVHGVRGGGVEVFYNRDKQGNWIQGNKRKFTVSDLKTLCRDILDGKYSLHNEPDTILIEERVKPHKVFRYHTFKGTPDVRIIVHNEIPVMGMLRLPTEKSEGKANLDLGAIGAGIDMAVGKTTSAIYGKAGKIERVPSTKVQISGLKIPFWNKILEYSIRASQISGLGFAAIDFLIDKEKGAVIIELNARPGLSVQLSNQAGLRSRLKKTSGLKVKSVKQGIRLAKDLFGGEIEDEIEAISGKKVIGMYENVKLYGINKKEYEGKAKIDTGATITSIDRNIAVHLGYEDALNYAEKILKDVPRFSSRIDIKEYAKKNKLNAVLEKHPDIVGTAIIIQSNGLSYRVTVKLELELDGIKFSINANVIDRSDLTYKILVGRRDLYKFLIDPSKLNSLQIKKP